MVPDSVYFTSNSINFARNEQRHAYMKNANVLCEIMTSNQFALLLMMNVI